jgi:hypothetical protein
MPACRGIFQALIFIDLRHRNVQPQGGLDQVVFDVVFVAPGRYDLRIARDKDGNLGVCYTKAMLTQYGIAAEKLDVKGVSAFGNRAGREA